MRTNQRDLQAVSSEPAWQHQQIGPEGQTREHALSSNFRQALRDALVSSEIRHLGARLTDFFTRLDPFLGVAVDQRQQRDLVDLYSRFSAEIDVLRAAAHQVEGAGEFLDSLADVLRTPLEEGIIACSSNPRSSYTPEKVKAQLVHGYRVELYSHAWRLKGLSPTSARDHYPLRVRVEEYSHGNQPLTTERFEELLSLNNSRVIDPTLSRLQEGFGRPLSADELAGFVERPSTVCCVPCDDEGALGYYVLDTNTENIPEVARKLIEQDTRFGQLREGHGWVDVIALATTARDRLRGPEDVWYIAHEYNAGEGSTSSNVTRKIALRPSHASDMGPGDYIRDTRGTLHRVASNSAYGNPHPTSCSIVDDAGETFEKADIDLYLKAQELSSPHAPCTREHSRRPAQLIQVLLATNVTNLVSGDFIVDRHGVLREVESNSAHGVSHPRSWQIHTTDGKSFDMFDYPTYLKCEQVTEECIQAQKPLSLYRWLTRTACETACSREVSTLWCQVRIGNAARKKHLAVGWESTGLKFQLGERDFEILRLDPFRIITGLSEADSARLRQEHSEHRYEYGRLLALSSEAWSTRPGALDEHYFRDIFSKRFPDCVIAYATDSIGRLRVTVEPESERPQYFLQGLAGHDLWRSQSDPSYVLSFDRPLTSLTELF